MVESKEQMNINLLTKISCKLDEVKTAIQNLPQAPALPEEPGTVVIVSPPKSTTFNNQDKQVQTTPTLIVPANSLRKNLLLANDSGVTIYLAMDNNVTVAGGSRPGFPLWDGGSYQSDAYIGPLYAIVSAATVIIHVAEEV